MGPFEAVEDEAEAVLVLAAEVVAGPEDVCCRLHYVRIGWQCSRTMDRQASLVIVCVSHPSRSRMLTENCH